MEKIKAHQLVTGDIIDLVPIIEEFELGSEISPADYSETLHTQVLGLSFEDGDVYVRTALLTFSVPTSHLVFIQKKEYTS